MAGGNGGAVGKIYIETALVDNFKQIAGQIKSGLGKGLKDLKDLDLQFGFNDKKFAQDASVELQSVINLLGTGKLSKMDYSGLIPPLTAALGSNLGDSIKLQLLQGFRQGLQEISKIATDDVLSNMMYKRAHPQKTLEAMAGYSALSDIVKSFGLNKTDTTRLIKDYRNAVGGFLDNDPDRSKNQLAQLMGVKEARDKGYGNVIKYLVDTKASNKELNPANTNILERLSEKTSSGDLTANDVKKVAGFFGRLKYFADEIGDNNARSNVRKIEQDTNFQNILKYIQAPENSSLRTIYDSVLADVVKASRIKDEAYQTAKESFRSSKEDPLHILYRLAAETVKEDAVSRKIYPLLSRDFEGIREISPDKLFNETIRSVQEDEGLKESAVVRAESAANRAEDAEKKVTKIVSEKEHKVGQQQVDGASKKAEKAETDTQQTRQEEIQESTIKTWNQLNKAEEKYNKLSQDIANLGQEQDALFERMRNTKAKSEQVQANYGQLNTTYSTQKNELDKRIQARDKLTRDLPFDRDDVKELDKEIENIKKKRTKLLSEITDLQKKRESVEQTKEYTEYEQAVKQRDALNAEREKIASQTVGRRKIKDIQQENNILNNIIDTGASKTLYKGNRAAVSTKGKDVALDLLKNAAEEAKNSNAEYQKVLTEYEKSSEAKQKILLPKLNKLKMTLNRHQLNFLKTFQNAKGQEGVTEQELLPYLTDNGAEYGLNLVSTNKKGATSGIITQKGALSKNADKLIQQQSNDIIDSLKQRQAANEKEIEELTALSNKQTELANKVKDLNIKNPRDEIDKQIKQKEAERKKLGEEQSKKETTRNIKQSNIQRKEEQLALPYYANIEQDQKELDKTQEQLQDLKKQQEDLDKEYREQEKQYNKQTNDIVKKQKEASNLKRNINLGESNLISQKKDEELETRRGELESRRANLEQELKKDDEVLAVGEAKIKDLDRQITNTQTDLANSQTEYNDKQNVVNRYDNIINQSKQKLEATTEALKAIREQKQKLINEQKEFDEETKSLTSQPDFDRRYQISQDIKNITGNIQQEKQDIKNLQTESSDLGNLLKGNMPDRVLGLAIDDLKAAAKANKEVQKRYQEALKGWQGVKFENPEEEKAAKEKFDVANEERIKSYIRYYRTWQNALKSGYEPKIAAQYLTEEYDPEGFFKLSEYSTAPKLSNFVLRGKDEYKDLARMLESRENTIEAIQKAILEQDNRVLQLREQLGKDWKDVDLEERAERAKKQQQEIDKLTEQENKLLEQENTEKANIKVSTEAKTNEQAAAEQAKANVQKAKEDLDNLQQQHTEEKAIYNKRKALQRERVRQIEDIKESEQKITDEIQRRRPPEPETVAPEATNEEGTEEQADSIVEEADEEIRTLENTIQQLREKKTLLKQKVEELRQLLAFYPQTDARWYMLKDNIEENVSKTPGAEDHFAYKNPYAQTTTKGARDQLVEKGNSFKKTVDAIKQQEKDLKKLDTNSSEYQKALKELQRLQDQKVRDWIDFYHAHKEFEKFADTDRDKRTLNYQVPEKRGDKDNPFTEENFQKMVENVKKQETYVRDTKKELEQLQSELTALEAQINQVREQQRKVTEPLSDTNAPQPTSGQQSEENASRTPANESGSSASPQIQGNEQQVNEMQQSREELEKARKALEEEMAQDLITLGEAQNKISSLETTIEKLENGIIKRNQSISRAGKERDSLIEQNQEIDEELWTLVNTYRDIKEKKELLQKELEEFNKETNTIDYNQQRDTILELEISEGVIEDYQSQYAKLNEKIIGLNRFMEVTPEMPEGALPAFQYFKEMAIANREAQRDYERWVHNDWSDIKPPKGLEEDALKEWNAALEERKKNAPLNADIAKLKYQRAWVNAMKQGTSPTRINAYLGKEYDADGILPESIEKDWQTKNHLNYEEWFQDDDSVLENLKIHYEGLIQEEIALQKLINDEKQERAKIEQSLGENWRENTPEARQAKSEAMQAEIDKLQEEETQAYNRILASESTKEINQGRIDSKDTYISQLIQSNEEDNAQLQQLKQQLTDQKQILADIEGLRLEKQQRLANLTQQIEQAKANESQPRQSGQTIEQGGSSEVVGTAQNTGRAVEDEGDKAGNATIDFQKLAEAKAAVAEANKKVASSADQTADSLNQEGGSASNIQDDFNTLIMGLSEIADVFKEFASTLGNINKDIDITPLAKQFDALTQSISNLPKEGFNVSLGEGFNNLSQKIGNALDKMNELTSQAKNEEISKSFAEKYDEQIKQLTEDLKTAQQAIESLKQANEELKASMPEKTLDTEENKIVPYPEDAKIAKEYENLKTAQKQLFNAQTVEEYNSALQLVYSTLQNISRMEQDALNKRITPTERSLMTEYGMSPYDYVADRFPAMTEARSKAQSFNESTVMNLAKDYIESQKAEIQGMMNALDSINIISKESADNGHWNKKRKAEYDEIVQGADAATLAVQVLNDQLEAMETNGVDAQTLQSFLILKENAKELISSTQGKNNTFNDTIEGIKDGLLSNLNAVEKKLLTIQSESKELVYINPELAGVLEKVEKHLLKIKELKTAVNKDSSTVLDPTFMRTANGLVTRLNGKEDRTGVIDDFEQISDRSQTDFDRIINNYNKYASALKKLFDDMAKGANVSLEQLQKDLQNVDYLAKRLTNATGLSQDQLLSGELNRKFAPVVDDAQSAAQIKTETAYEAMFTKIESKAESAQSKINKIFGDEGVVNGLNSNFIQGSVEGFDDFVNSAKQAEESLNHLLEIQQAAKNDLTWTTQEKNIADYQQTMDTLEESLDAVVNKANDFKIVDDLDVQKLRASTAQFIRDNPALSGEDVSKFEGYIDQLQGKINDVDFKTIKAGIEGVKQTAIEAGRTGDTFFSMLTQRFKSLGAYLLSFVSFYRVIGVFKDGINIVHELDDALTEMQKVSEDSLGTLREYQKTTFATANDIGTTASQLQQSTADWLRLGEDLQQASQSAQTANVLFNVSEFNSIDEATTALVAMSAAYADAEEGIEKIDIVDRLNLIGNNYAIATDELATALQDGAATLQTAGNDLDEAIALTTAGNLITQDASKTGKGIRTIALRLTGTKEAAEELEEMGEDTSDMIMSQSKMRELIMNATKVASNNYQGFDIQDELGRYKSTYEIMLGLAQIWDEIQQADFKTGDNRQNLLLESIAGKNRASIAASILQNPKTLMDVYEDSSTKAAGSAMEENQKYLDSISGHLAKLQNAWQEFWASTANRDVINMFIDLGTTILNIINEVGGLQSAFALLYGGTILKGLMTADSLLVKFVSRLDEAKASSKSLGDVFNTVFGSNKSDSENKSIFKGWEQIQNQRDKRAKAKANPETEASEKQKEVQEEMNDILEEANELKEESIKVSEEKAAAEIVETTAETADGTATAKSAVSETIDSKATEDNTKKTTANTSATIANTAAEDAQSESKITGSVSEEIDGMGEMGNAAGAGGLVSLATSPVAWLIAIPAIIGGLTALFAYLDQQQQNHIDKAHELTNAWNENKESLNNYTQQYQDLSTQLDNVNLSESEQADIKAQLYELQKQITDEYRHSADGIDLVNGKLDEQLDKLRNIKVEEARSNLAHNAGDYENAEEKLTKDRQVYNMSSGGFLSDEDIDTLTEGLIGNWEKYDYSGQIGIRFTGNALEAEESMDELYNRLLELKKEMGEDWSGSGFEGLMNSLTASIQKNDEIITKYKNDYNSFLEQSIFADKGVYGAENLSAGEVLTELEEAVNDYNIALQSGDLSQIDEAKTRFEELNGLVDNIVASMGDDKYKRPFEDITDRINKTAETTYNINKKMQDSKVKTTAEAVFGKLADNKKVSKQVQDEVLDAAGEILSMQRELAKNGLTDILSPLYEDIDTTHTSRFGNVDLANRPVLKWNDATRQRYSQAWASWNTDKQGNVEPMYDNGTISTVLGMWDDKFGANKNISIAFTPLLNTGSELEYLDADTVYNYINDLIEQATDESGKLDTNKLFTLDADPKSGKNLIMTVGEASEKIASIGHYLGKDGAYTTAMARLKKAAEQANIPVEKIIASMRNLGNRSGIREMFADTLPSVEDVRMALADTTGQFQELQDFAQQNFEITAETPDAEIQGFIEAMQLAGLVTTTTAEDSQKSLDDFYTDVSNKINKISELTSIASKGLGQGGLSFTKMLDENKKLVESDVSKITDSFQHIYDFDIGSLFEETATGIKLNMDSYRQLVQEEESITKLQFANKRKELESNLALAEKQGASKSEIRKIQEQITDLDMLAAAYDGATSATAKYLAQQNAADYGDAYEMFRDTTVKRADELMSKGMIGTEEFRTIAQLFSYDSLASASASEVLKAYQTGYNNVKKYITEDATVGMQTFLDDLVALPEEYGKFIKDADGGYMLEFTDAQEDALAKHLGVSKDMLESFYDMLNALGFDIHFFRDGTLDEFDKLNNNIHDSQEKLKELKKTANDKELIPDDLLQVDPNQLNTVEELQNYLNQLSQLKIDPEVNPEEYELWKQLLEDIQKKIDVLNSGSDEKKEFASIGDYQQADEALSKINEKLEYAQGLAEKGIDVHAAIQNDQELREYSEMIANWPPEVQSYLGFLPTKDSQNIMNQIEEWSTKGIKTKFDLDDESKKILQDGSHQEQKEIHERTYKDTVENTTVTANTTDADQKLANMENRMTEMDGKGFKVTGEADVTDAEEKLTATSEDVASIDGARATVTVNGNTTPFNQKAKEAGKKADELSKKKNEMKILGDASSATSAARKAKDAIDDVPKRKESHLSVITSGFSTVRNFLTDVYDKLKDKEVKIKTTQTTTKETIYKNSSGGHQTKDVDGTAHAQGTFVSKGHAYTNGMWGLPKAEKGALINELGSEIVVTPDGHWRILNNGDPTFTNLPKGAIVFNHKQSEQLLKNGYVTGSHGKMVGGAFATGTVDNEDLDEEEFEGEAYAIGTAKWNGQLIGMSHAGSGTGSLNSAKEAQKKTSSSNKSSNKSNKSSNKNKGKSNKSNSSNKSSKDTLQTLDAIEIRLNRIDALISQLDATAGKTYESFGTRNKALKDDLATVNKEIQAINASLKSADTSRSYLKKAAAAAKEAGLKSGDEGYSAGSEGASGKALSQTWIKKIQNSVNSGQYFTLSDVRNEGLWKKIQAYQTWYEKYVKLQQKVQEQTAKLSQLTIQQLSLIQSKWEATLNTISANITTYQNRIDLLAEQGYNASEDYYTNQILENQKKVDALTSEASDLQKKLDEAVKTGRIKQYSEEWFKWYNQIKGIKNEIIATNKEMQTLLNSIRQLRWDRFDHGQERLADLADEMEFLGGLINEIDLFDKDTGIITDKGKAAFGLEAQRYDIYIKQAQKYKEAVKQLNKEINEDFKTNKKYNQTLIEQRDTWLKAQREAIENAHSEKEAIADLVEKGIKKQIEAMEELIDKYEEALDAEKDQQKYADDIAERQKKINSLQKQLRAMEGDDSEEGASRRQKLRDELKEAQKDLQETQEDQRISDIKEALSNMQERYEEVLNARLDNIDALLEEVVSGVNQNGADICETIKGVATSVGYDITGILNNIYTGVQNLNTNVANVANQSEALVSGSTDNGSATNTSAKTLTESTTPTVPTSPTMPSAPQKATAATNNNTTNKSTSSSKNGLIKENSKTYYYKNGKKQTGWQTINGKKYYFSTKDNAMLTGVQKIGSKYYLLDSKTGALKNTYTGLYKQGSNTYYFKSGNIQTGWQNMKEGRRYFSVNSGKMLTGLQKIGGDDYYFNSNGILQTGTFSVKDYTYETDKDGKIKKKTARTGTIAMKTVSNGSSKNISSNIPGIGTIKGKLASGTSSVVRSGMYRVDEEGNEVFINKQGKIYTRLGKGTAVLPHDAAVNLLKGMSDPVNFIASHMDMRPNKNISTTNNTNGDTINNITFEMNGITNYAEFMREAQRDPNFTKYIQEISIGKLNGHNSLKGNSIRFR